MKRILIDTNVVIDCIIEDEPYHKDAQTVMDEVINGSVQGYITASMATDIFYLLQKKNDKTFALNSLVDLLQFIDVLTVYRDDVFDVLHSGWTDFEDALQAHVAGRSGVDAIVTRNAKDFENAKNLDVVFPQDFIHYLNVSR